MKKILGGFIINVNDFIVRKRFLCCVNFKMS